MPTLTVTLHVDQDGRPRPATQVYQLTAPAMHPFATTLLVGGDTWTVTPTEGIRVVQALVVTVTADALVQWTTHDPAAGGIALNPGGALVLLGTAITQNPILFITNQGADQNRIRGILLGLP